MSFNTFGHLFRVTTWGESHGPAIGCVVDGCPPGIPLERGRHPALARQAAARPVALHHPAAGAGHGRDPVRRVRDEATGRQVTTGTPIALLIDNVDQRSKDYAEIKDSLPPGPRRLHLRRQIRHPRLSRRRPRLGARDRDARRRRRHRAQDRARPQRARRAGPDGRAERSTAPRWDWDEVERNPFFWPDAKAAAGCEEYLDGVRKAGLLGRRGDRGRRRRRAGRAWARRSTASSTPTSPAALMSINAVKGVEIGAGFAAAALTGEDNADEMRMGNDGKPRFLSNHAGGILGGISTGQPIVARFAVKPTSSILTPRKTDRPLRQRGRDRRPRAATTPASASAPCRSARRCWPA